ncbi:putative glycolipid-binding domain-containing protein [Pinisolibacter aquiterrae]|uniref:putative glycolipid-binding domain-containing protein n=1 Tax=Pinisolibacter aquiterrae TaxID=2815579 RepID=UPI001C3C4450|nr:putative glycolipid-binding domain-containing protein [Pinisolibacter aquiterrae]MBV5265493.1 putative glycolipid-binding domain-containing protein [Pinisolibacter aquiterrae]MCC8236940.1 putative glycolipid-binding domain-containing protein [Pinisolibacter aquiterrae]
MSGTHRSLRWRTLRGGDGEGADAAIGLEHVDLKIAETGITAEGVAIGGEGETAFGARWRIGIDAEWACVRSLHLTRLGGATVALRHDGYGAWTDGEGKPRKDFAGILDVFVEGSPFGLMALVKRLAKKAEKAQALEAIHVSLPDLAIAKIAVTLKPSAAGRHLAVTLGETGLEVDLDEDGVPERFGALVERVAAP